MIKKLGLATAMGALLLSGCGGGGSSKSITEQMKERDAILIVHDYPAEVCTSQLLKDELAADIGATDIITSVEPNTINCGDYARNNDYISCGEETFGGYPDTCVIGMNAPEGTGLNSETIMATVPDIMFQSL